MRLSLTRIVATLLLLVLALATVATQNDKQDICILQHLSVAQISGRVVTVRSNAEAEQPLSGAIIELRHIGEQDVIEQTFSDEKGNFLFRNIAVGNYSLAARPPASHRPALFATAVEVRLGKPKPGNQTKEIVLGLGWEFEGCHGGYAQVRKKSR